MFILRGTASIYVQRPLACIVIYYIYMYVQAKGMGLIQKLVVFGLLVLCVAIAWEWMNSVDIEGQYGRPSDSQIIYRYKLAVTFVSCIAVCHVPMQNSIKIRELF